MSHKSNFARRSNFGWVFLVVLTVGCFLPIPASVAQSQLDAKPIYYLSSEADDPISRWIKELGNKQGDNDGSSLSENEPKAEWDPKLGWLPALLEGLNVPAESQTLVFSKTSLQIRSISPENPRAIYFNDNVYVGYVPGGKLIELSAVDPDLGAIFYAVEQRESAGLAIRRENHQCLSCHSSAKTKGVPGYLVRSVFPAASGHPVYSLGTKTTDHTVPLKDRFGGWYISTESKLEHRGNCFVVDGGNRRPTNEPPELNRFPVPPVVSSHSFSPNPSVRLDRYIHNQSNLLALMVLEHQTQGHNVLTASSWDVQQALDYQKVINEALGREADFESESTKRRIDRAIENIVRYFLFADEAKLDFPLPIDSDFSSRFQAMGPIDNQGRSLRQFDGQRRLFTYPCSFLIHSESFTQLPEVIRSGVLERISQLLNDREPPDGLAHLDQDTRVALDQILSETVADYPPNVP